MKKNITEEVLSDDEFMDIVTPILENSEFYKRKKWQHHEHSSLYEHSLAVSYLTYKICKKKRVELQRWSYCWITSRFL